VRKSLVSKGNWRNGKEDWKTGLKFVYEIKKCRLMEKIRIFLLSQNDKKSRGWY